MGGRRGCRLTASRTLQTPSPVGQARTLLGRWLSCVRSCQRMLQAWAPPRDAALVAEFTRWNAALTAAGCEYLCRDRRHWDACRDVLQPAELNMLAMSDNPPVLVTAIMSELLARCGCGRRTCAQRARSILQSGCGPFTLWLFTWWPFTIYIPLCMTGGHRPPPPPHTHTPDPPTLQPFPAARAHLSAQERTAIEAELMAFDLSLAGLERITRQAIPRAYTQ